MIDLKAHLKGSSLPERTVLVCLRGDLTSALADAETALAEADESAPKDARLVGGSGKQAQQVVGDARQAVQDAALPFRMRGLSRVAWTRLVNEHPPRPDNSDDRLLSFNADSFPPALVAACLVDPDVSDPADWAALDDALTFGQFDELVSVAMDLSRRKVDIPFSSAGSAKTGSSGPKSSKPAA